MTVIDTPTDFIASAAPGYWLPPSAQVPVVHALTADGGPIVPPAAWFANPHLTKATPLTITADGQCYGHLATWNSSHIGMAGKVKPPRSRSNYAFFATGAVLTDSGEQVPVGQLTLVGGHAPLNASVARAVAHYDDTKSAVADVAVGEDKHGIWVAGGVRPNVPAEDIRILRASAVSGDWRPINGNLELVAACSVNVPGFPIPRARVASGQMLALVAAGIEPLVEARIEEMGSESLTAALDSVRSRVHLLENTIYELSMDKPSIDRELVGTKAVTASALRTRVKGDPAAKLRSRVHAG